MCTLNTFDYETFETDESVANTINASADAATLATDAKTSCAKCGCHEIHISLRCKNRYCKACFLSILTHKFRATLGKSKSVRPNDSILIAHSGKANSTVLAHLIKANANESVPKRLRCQWKILYIDDGIAKGRTIEERERIRNMLATEADDLRLPTLVLSLSRCTIDNLRDEIQSINVPWASIADNDVLMQEMFSKLENDTARDELLHQLRRELLVSAARKLDCNKIFIADTSVDLAIKVLGNVSTGRGSQLSLNVGFSDTRCVDVTLLRPLRDFTEEDVVGYLECCEIIPVFASLKYNQPFPASIRSITENFVRRLDSEFHSTVSTIYRTSEKLATKTNANADINDICIICGSTVDSCYSQEQPSVVEARTFSRLVSTGTDCSSNVVSGSLNLYGQSKDDDEQVEGTGNLDKKICHCESTACAGILPNEPSLQPETLEKYLCYGCRLIFLDSNGMCTAIPDFIFNKIRKELQITSLRKEITDFLL